MSAENMAEQHPVEDTAQRKPRPAFELIAIGASAGGFQPLLTILGELPGSLPAAVLVVLHLSPNHPSRLVELIERRCQLHVAQAADGISIQPGTIYVAPPDWHLLVNTDRTIALAHTQLVHFVRPSADLLFESAAAVYCQSCLAVVLSGSGSDGSLGVQAVKKMGGAIIAQDERTSEYFGMPGAAIATGAVDFVLPVQEIASSLVHLVLTGVLKP